MTTSISLNAHILLLVHHRYLQTQLKAELDSVIGARGRPGDRTPTLGDKPHCRLMEATILEVLRYRSHAPLSQPHPTVAETTLDGYRMPCNTKVTGTDGDS